jgi:hypothetical protein
MKITEWSGVSKFKLILLLFGSVLLFLIAALFYLYVLRGFPVNPDIIIISKSEITDGKLVITGITESSASAYSGYNMQEKDGKLILNIRYVTVPTKWHPNGDFRIEIPQKDIAAIHQVYLQGKGNSEKLVWRRASTNWEH